MDDFSKAMSTALEFKELIGLPDDSPLTRSHYANVRKAMGYMSISYFQYSALVQKGNINELVSLFGEDGAAVIKNNRKFIVINDIRTKENASKYRPLWTLMHELGHFMLNHLDDKDCIRLRNEKYDWFERETNAFTANVLLSENALYSYISKKHPDDLFLDCNTLGSIHKHFNVSWDALIYRLDFLGIQSANMSKFLVNTYKERKKVASCKNISLASTYMVLYAEKLWIHSEYAKKEDFITL